MTHPHSIQKYLLMRPAEHSGKRALSLSLAAGNAQLARELVARGAAVEVSRADGGNVRGLDHG